MKHLTALVFMIVVSFCLRCRAGEIADLFTKLESEGHIKIAPPAAFPRKADTRGVTEIGLERGPCFGTCPVYTIILKSDGTFRYHGEVHAARTGDFTGHINVASFVKLAEFIKESNYEDLDDSYRVGITDHATVYTTATIDGKQKIISDYAGAGPAKLWVVELMIDKLIDSAEWDVKDAAAGSSTQPADQ